MSDDYTPYMAFAADLHLQPGAWASHPHVKGDSYEALRQIVTFCVTRECPLILGGDIFDKRRPDPHSVGVFISQMHRMQNNGVPVMFIQGDHDYAPDTAWPDVAQNHVYHLHGTWLAEWPKLGKVYGLDWTPKDRLAEAIAAIPPDCDVLVTHQSWDELQGIGNVEGQIRSLPGNVKTLLTGDYHEHKQLRIRADAGQEIHVLSAGSTCMQAIDENPAKHFWVYSAHDERDDGVWTSQPLLGRMVYEFDLPDEDTFDRWAAETVCYEQSHHPELPEELHKPIVRIKYADNIPDAVARIKAATTDIRGDDMVHLFLKPEHVYVERCVEIEEAPEGAFDTIEGAVQQLGEDDDVVNGVHRLLRSENPTQEIEVMMGEFLHAQAGTIGEAEEAELRSDRVSGQPDATVASTDAMAESGAGEASGPTLDVGPSQ